MSFGDPAEVILDTLYDAQKPLKEGFAKTKPCQKLKESIFQFFFNQNLNRKKQP